MTTPAVSIDEFLGRFLAPFDSIAIESLVMRRQPLIGALDASTRREIAGFVRGYGYKRLLLQPTLASTAIARMRPDLADLLKRPEARAWLSSEVRLLKDLGNWTADHGDPPGGTTPG